MYCIVMTVSAGSTGTCVGALATGSRLSALARGILRLGR